MKEYLLYGLLGVVLAGITGWAMYEKGISRGKEIVVADNVLQELSQLKVIRVEEQKIIKDQTAIDKAYQEGIIRGKKHNADVLARINANNLKLYDQYRSAAATCTTPDSPVGDGQAGSELSAKTTGDLWSLAGDADEVVEQLNACQQLLEARQ